MWEIRQAVVIEVAFTQDQKAFWEAKVSLLSFPGGPEQTLYGGLSYDSSLLFREVVETIERFTSTFRAMTEEPSTTP